VLHSNKRSLQKSKEFIDNLRRRRGINDNIVDQIEEIKAKMILLDLHKQSNEIEHATVGLEKANLNCAQVEREIARVEQEKETGKQLCNQIERDAQAIAQNYRQSDLNLACKEKQTVQKLEARLKNSQKKMQGFIKNKNDNEKKRVAIQASIGQLDEQIDELEKQIQEINERLEANNEQLNIDRAQVDQFIRYKKYSRILF